MQQGASSAWILIAAVAGAGFVWVTSQSLPPLVASHFGSGGIATGFIPHKTYVFAAMCACIAFPLVLVLPMSAALNHPRAVINVPNRDHWLTPERRPETIAYVRKQMVRFGVGLLVFICYVHWLVVRANELTPPRIPAGPFVSALAVFVGFVLLWVALFFARFRNVPG
jgi:hypothetical protein